MATKKKTPSPVVPEAVDIDAATEMTTDDDHPRRRGRPKGSKNRPKEGLLLKRGPGRPRGSGKNSNGLESELGHRIDAMINELHAIRAEVSKLEQVRSVLRELQGM